MTQDEIIEIAKEAGCIPRRHPEYWDDVQVFATPDVIQAFAKLVAERALADSMQEVQRLGQEIEQEPVAWMSPSWIDPNTRGWQSDSFESIPIEGWLPIYTHPPQRTEEKK